MRAHTIVYYLITKFYVFMRPLEQKNKIGASVLYANS
jgi:hypothetical protein